MKWLLVLALVACGKSGPQEKETAASAPNAEKKGGGVCAVQFPVAQDCASLTWISKPVGVQPGAFLLQFKNAKGASYNLQASLSIVLKMDTMSHRHSPQIIKIPEMIGVYRVSDVLLEMPGAWTFEFTLKNADGTFLDRAVYRFSNP